MKTFCSKEKKRLSAVTTPAARKMAARPEGRRQAGAVRQILGHPRIQAKLTVSPPNDAYEQEADRVADAVMRMPEEALSRQPLEEEEELLQTKPDIFDGCSDDLQRQVEEEEEELLQAKRDAVDAVAVTPELEQAISSSRGTGQALPENSRTFFEPRMGVDLGNVQIHSGAQAADWTRAGQCPCVYLGIRHILRCRAVYPGIFRREKASGPRADSRGAAEFGACR